MYPENDDPLNQVSKRLLKEAGSQARASSLFSVQLMRWALDEGVDGLRPELYDRISGTVDVLLGAEPKDAMNYLVQSQTGDPDEVRLRADDLEGLSPEMAAQELLESLHSLMSETVPGYPIAAPLP